MCFTETLRVAAGRKLAVMIGKDIEEFPENSHRLTGTIDIWWIVRILLLEKSSDFTSETCRNIGILLAESFCGLLIPSSQLSGNFVFSLAVFHPSAFSVVILPSVLQRG